MVLLTIFLTGATTIAGLYFRKINKLREISHFLGWGLFALWMIYNAYYFLPSTFDWKVSLPLHVCDLLAPVASLALITENRTARAVLYFSALTMAGQAIYTPTGNQDPTTTRFWLYWFLHAGIISAFVFDLLARRFRPTTRDFSTVLLLTLIYAALIVPLNVAFEWNYGYLGNSKPDAPTALDVLGPWPQRIATLLLLAAALELVMYLPCLVFQRFKNNRADRS